MSVTLTLQPPLTPLTAVCVYANLGSVLLDKPGPYIRSSLQTLTCPPASALYNYVWLDRKSTLLVQCKPPIHDIIALQVVYQAYMPWHDCSLMPVHTSVSGDRVSAASGAIVIHR